MFTLWTVDCVESYVKGFSIFIGLNVWLRVLKMSFCFLEIKLIFRQFLQRYDAIMIINPLTARSDQREISLYNINTLSNRQERRITKIVN